MLSRLVRALLLAATACVSVAHAEDVVFPPGSAVGLAPPAGLKPAQGFSGFQDSETNASIVVVEMPAEAYGQIVAKLTPAALAAMGFTVAGEAEAWPLAGAQARIMRGTQTAHGLRFSKWVVVAGTPTATAMVTAQRPEAARGTIPDEAIEAALRTITMRAPAGVDDQMAALTFRIGDLAGLRVVRAIAGSSLLLTEGPKDVVKDGSQPLVIVASSLGTVAPDGDRAALARRALSQLKQIRDVEVGDAVREAGGPVEWVRHEGTAIDASTGQPVRVVQVMRFEGAGYVRVIGLGRASDAALSQKARRLAASITLR